MKKVIYVVNLVRRCSFDKNHPKDVEIPEILGCFRTLAEASKCVKAEFKRLYPQKQELLDEHKTDEGELGFWEGPEGDGSTSRRVRVWNKQMELQRHYSGDSRAEVEKDEPFLSGFVDPGLTFDYAYDVTKVPDFSVGK